MKLGLSGFLVLFNKFIEKSFPVQNPLGFLLQGFTFHLISFKLLKGVTSLLLVFPASEPQIKGTICVKR